MSTLPCGGRLSRALRLITGHELTVHWPGAQHKVSEDPATTRGNKDHRLAHAAALMVLFYLLLYEHLAGRPIGSAIGCEDGLAGHNLFRLQCLRIKRPELCPLICCLLIAQPI